MSYHSTTPEQNGRPTLMHPSSLTPIFTHAFLDTIPMVPVLLALYAALEVVSHREGFQLLARSRTVGALGPVAGALLGAVPQCGMSVFMTSLYLTNRVTAGALVATYLSTSDEALPILLAHGGQGRMVLLIVVAKVALAIVAGLGLDLVARRVGSPDAEAHGVTPREQQVRGELEHAGFGRIAVHSLKHTLEIYAWVLVATVAIALAMGQAGATSLVESLRANRLAEVVGIAVFGLVPNCAASVAIAEGYVRGVLTAGATFAGLAAGAGYGPILLVRDGALGRATALLGFCYVVSVAAGLGVNAIFGG